MLPKYLLIGSRQSQPETSPPDRGNPVPLKSFPEQTITLPLGSAALTARSYGYDSLPRSQVLAECVVYLHQSLKKLGLLQVPGTPRLLLILPDNTRTAIASHLLVDAVLELKESYPQLEFTILFGLGTHPLMAEEEICQLLGKDRYKRLQDLNISLQQQTTLAPLEPQQTVLVTDPPFKHSAVPSSFTDLRTAIAECQQKLEQALLDCPQPLPETEVTITEAPSFQPYSLSLPGLLWQHDWAIVAGDTQLHPYEGRGGSGGIHKMLVVGLANIHCIRRTHSTKVLLSPKTRMGQVNNAFVHSLDHLAQVLGRSLLTNPYSRARTLPLGLSVATNPEGQIYGLWLGQQERDRQQLTAILQEAHTVPLSQPLHIAIADVEPYRATDICASARPLQYLCQWDEVDKPLLAATPHQRVALVFHPSHQTKTQDGIGNRGTKKQLDVLQQFVQDCQGQLQASLAKVNNWQEALKILAAYRQQVLEKWTEHLHISSETEDFLILLEKLVFLIRRFESLKLDSTAISNHLKTILKKYANAYSEVGQNLENLLNFYLTGGKIEDLEEQIRDLQSLYHDHEGLGEGGQRALRLLILLQKFETFLIATDNPETLDYLSKLDPDLYPALPTKLKACLPDINWRLGLLGIVGIDLRQVSPQMALERAIAYARYYNPQTPDPHIGLIQAPLIVYRTELTYSPR